MADEDDPIISFLRRRIVAQQLRPGERLGTERGLSDELGVPRSAVRAALERMEIASEIRRAMGSTGGVFVSDGKIERHLNTTQGVPDMLRQQGYTPHTEVIRAELGLADPGEARALRLNPGASVVRLLRRRDADGTPLSLDSMILPSALVPGLQQRNLSSGVYRTLHHDYGIEVSQSDETIDMTEATADQAHHLDIAPGDPLFEIWRVTTDTRERVIELGHDYFRADRTRITLRRHGARWKRAIT